jgi:hypothetical protein
MARYFCPILLSLLVPSLLAVQAPAPVVSIELPAAIPPESVQTQYFMFGAFGGEGGRYPASKAGIRTIQIDASHEAQPAAEIRLVEYAPGCDFMTFTLSLKDNPTPTVRFVCKAIPMVSVTGRFPSELIGTHNAEIVVRYRAYWVQSFFGLLDAIVSSFDIARISPEKDGRFHLELPDLSLYNKDSDLHSDGDFAFTLRDSNTWNPLADLVPEVPSLKAAGFGGLKAQSSYPVNLQFVSAR